MPKHKKTTNNILGLAVEVATELIKTVGAIAILCVVLLWCIHLYKWHVHIRELPENKPVIELLIQPSSRW